MQLTTSLNGFGSLSVIEHLTMAGYDLKAENNAEHPNNVVPHSDGKTTVDGNEAVSELAPYSWNVIRLKG